MSITRIPHQCSFLNKQVRGDTVWLRSFNAKARTSMSRFGVANSNNILHSDLCSMVSTTMSSSGLKRMKFWLGRAFYENDTERQSQSLFFFFASTNIDTVMCFLCTLSCMQVNRLAGCGLCCSCLLPAGLNPPLPTPPGDENEDAPLLADGVPVGLGRAALEAWLHAYVCICVHINLQSQCMLPNVFER